MSDIEHSEIEKEYLKPVIFRHFDKQA